MLLRNRGCPDPDGSLKLRESEVSYEANLNMENKDLRQEKGFF
jgi:hypothetical protein